MVEEQLVELTVDAIMQNWPVTIPVFIHAGMHCVGCPVGGLHTLEDAALAHRLDLPTLVASISAIATPPDE